MRTPLTRLRPGDERTRKAWFTAIVVLSWVYSIVAPAVQSFTAAKYETNALTPGVPDTPLTHRIELATQGLLLAACVLVVVLSIDRLPRDRYVALAALLAPWVFLVLRDRYALTSPRPVTLFFPMIVIAIWCLRPRLAWLTSVGVLVAGTAVLSLAMGQFLPAKGLYQAAPGSSLSVDTKFFSSGLLVGPLSNGSNLGQFLAMGLAAVLLLRPATVRLVLTGAVVLAALWAGSRSCVVAIVLMLVMGFLQRGLPGRWRGVASAAVLVPLAALVVALPIVTTDPQDFTNRGGIWASLKPEWEQHRWIGRGSAFFTRIADTSSNLGGAVFHAHNQYMQDLVIGGYVFAGLMGAAMLVAIVAAVRLANAGYEFPSVFLTALIGACLLEVSFVVVDRFFVLTVMLIPFACLVFTTEADVASGSDDMDEDVGTDSRDDVHDVHDAIFAAASTEAPRLRSIRPGAGFGRPRLGASPGQPDAEWISSADAVGVGHHGDPVGPPVRTRS